MPKYKTIFSLRIRTLLRQKGIEPLFECPNLKIEGYKCWVYSWTDELQSALDDILGGDAQ